jgi:hypothetical protein
LAVASIVYFLWRLAFPQGRSWRTRRGAADTCGIDENLLHALDAN